MNDTKIYLNDSVEFTSLEGLLTSCSTAVLIDDAGSVESEASLHKLRATSLLTDPSLSSLSVDTSEVFVSTAVVVGCSGICLSSSNLTLNQIVF